MASSFTLAALWLVISPFLDEMDPASYTKNDDQSKENQLKSSRGIHFCIREIDDEEVNGKDKQ